MKDDGVMRTFPGGATRDTAEGKLEPWGFTSPLAEKAFCEYMHACRRQPDGNLRASDNWKRGIPLQEYAHSLSRHILDLRLQWEGFGTEAREQAMITTLCAIRFNVDGILHELLKTELDMR